MLAKLVKPMPCKDRRIIGQVFEDNVKKIFLAYQQGFVEPVMESLDTWERKQWLRLITQFSGILKHGRGIYRGMFRSMRMGGGGVPVVSGETYKFHFDADGTWSSPTYTMGASEYSAGDTTGTVSVTNQGICVPSTDFAYDGTKSLKIYGDGSDNAYMQFAVSADDIFNDVAGYIEFYIYAADAPAAQISAFEIYSAANNDFKIILRTTLEIYAAQTGNNVMVALTSTAKIILDQWNKVEVRWHQTGDHAQELSININDAGWEYETDADVLTPFASGSASLIKLGGDAIDVNGLIYIDNISIWTTYDKT